MIRQHQFETGQATEVIPRFGTKEPSYKATEGRPTRTKYLRERSRRSSQGERRNLRRQFVRDLEKDVSKKLTKFLRAGEFCSRPMVDVLQYLKSLSDEYSLEHLIENQLHRDGRQRFEVRSTGGLEVVATESYRRHQDGEQTLRIMIDEIKKFDQMVRERSGKQVQADDRPNVDAIKKSIRVWMLSKSWLQSCESFKMDEVPGVMKRLHLYRGDGIEVRLHLFEDAHETVIHNHRASFWSCNLKGSYLHHLWGVTGDKEQHYMLNRTQDPELTGEMVAVPGKLDILYSNEYAEGDVYFLHQVALHTVQPTHGSSVLTIQIKAAHAAGETIVKSHDNTLPPERHVGDADIEGEQRSQLLRRMSKLLRTASTRSYRRNRSAVL